MNNYVPLEEMKSNLCDECRALPIRAIKDKPATDRLCDPCGARNTYLKAKEDGSLLELTDLNHLPSPEPFVKGRFNSRSVSMVYGEPATFKSFLMLDYVLTLASNDMEKWFGHNIVKHARTLFVTNEGVGGLKKRVAAWLKHNQAVAPEGVKVYIPKNPLWDRSTGQPVLDEIVEVARTMEADLIVFDTLSSLFGGIGENASEDISIITNRLAAIRNNWGISSMIVHHATKANADNYRGSSAMLGNTDEVYSIKRNESGSTLRSKKVKDEEDWSISFTVEKVVVGTDADGDDLTSLVVIPCNLPEAPLKDRIVDYLTEQEGHPLTVNAIRTGLGEPASESTFRRTVQTLAEVGRIRQIDIKGGPRSNAPRYGCLVPPERLL